jgi:hypothetical protein
MGGIGNESNKATALEGRAGIGGKAVHAYWNEKVDLGTIFIEILLFKLTLNFKFKFKLIFEK